MTNFIKTQNSFAYGEVSPEFYSVDNLAGLSRLENMDVISGGGLTRRKGLKSVATVDSAGRLIPFSVGENDNYVLLLTDSRLRIYKDDTKVYDMIAPWQYDDLATIQYAQRFGTIMFVHPGYRPRILEKTSGGFTLSKFAFSTDANGAFNMPKTRFDDSQGVTITVSSSTQGNTYATFTTNIAYWTPEFVSSYIYISNKQWLITEYISPTQVTASLGETYSVPGTPISDWQEGVFSDNRGWPCAISFHQDRLVFGGTRSFPSCVWMSRVGQHSNFNVGTGLDDEAIILTLLSHERQQICTIVSSDNLQILTSVGEWAISNKPLTPSNIDIKQHTSVGSVCTRNLPPQQIEGKTVFVSRNQKDIRELSLDDLRETYNATDLCAYSKHLLGAITDIAYNANSRQLYVVLSDGNMSVLNQNSALDISAWGRYTTSGNFMSVAVVADNTYVLVQRGAQYCLERFDAACLMDAESCAFRYMASAMPFRVSGHEITHLRIKKISARVMNTKSIFINGTRINLPNEIYAIDSPGFTGDVFINQLGTSTDYSMPGWEIHGTESLPITVLSVTTYGRYTI